MAKAKPVMGIDAQATTGENARIIARARLEEVELWGRYAHDPQRSDELHDLRIAAKRLRYTLEIFADALPQEITTVIAEVTQIQEELGALHDSDVMMALLRLCIQQEHENASGEDEQQQIQESYAQAIAAQEEVGKHIITNLELVASLLAARTAPSQAQRASLQHLLQDTIQQRGAHYNAFRIHWDRLQTQNFQHSIQSILDAK